MDAPVIPSFRYTKPATLHHSTVGRLVEWLERHVNALYPDNGIENWYVPKRMPDMGHSSRGKMHYRRGSTT